MMLRLSHVEALRSDLKQYDRILLGPSNACFYVGTYSTLLLKLFCLFYDDIDIIDGSICSMDVFVFILLTAVALRLG